jgi:hypothetical protein
MYHRRGFLKSPVNTDALGCRPACHTRPTTKGISSNRIGDAKNHLASRTIALLLLLVFPSRGDAVLPSAAGSIGFMGKKFGGVVLMLPANCLTNASHSIYSVSFTTHCYSPASSVGRAHDSYVRRYRVVGGSIPPSGVTFWKIYNHCRA